MFLALRRTSPATLETVYLANRCWALREGDISFLSPTSFYNFSVTVSYFVLDSFAEHHTYSLLYSLMIIYVKTDMITDQ